MRWLAGNVRAILAMAAIICAVSFSVSMGWVAWQERQHREQIVDQLESAADRRDALAVDREESARALEDNVKELLDEIREPTRAEGTVRAEVFASVPEIERMVVELCEATEGCSP